MSLVRDIEQSIANHGTIGHESALALERLSAEELFDLFALTRSLRRRASGNRVFLCSIVNAKSGACPEDCRFCAQSARYSTGAKVYGLMDKDQILDAARDAKRGGAREFSIVTSGKGVREPSEVQAIAEALAGIAALGLHPCASPGVVDDPTLAKWKQAGLERYHHNLETARSFFAQVCTTHDYEEDVEMIRRAQAHGLPVCSGGIFGMGESWAQRVELAETLVELQVDSAPLNFLDPIPGTPMAETAPGISALEALRTIALFRLFMPKSRVILCGGRQKNLRDLQALVFDAGANALMVGNYLTTLGRAVDADRQMLRDLALEAAAP